MAGFEFKDLSIDPQTVEVLQVMQAQLGLDQRQIVDLTWSVGIAAARMLVDASAKSEGVDPRVDIIVRLDNRTDSPIVEQTAQTLSSLINLVTQNPE